MDRSELLSILKRAEPALAVRDVAENYTSLFFDGEFVYAYDGLVAIRVPCKAPVSGGVRGQQVIAFLSACSAEKMEFKGDATTFHLKVGTANLKMPLAPIANNPSPAWPKPAGEDAALKVTKAFEVALKAVGVTLGTDPSMPALCGITVSVGKKSVKLTSAVSHAASIAYIGEAPPEALRGARVLLPLRFCELILASSPKALVVPGPGFKKSEVEALYADGSRVRASTIAEDVDLSAIEKIEANVKWDGHAKLPNKANLQGALDRALVVLGGDVEKESKVRVSEGRLQIHTRGEYGAFGTDGTKLDGDHPELEVMTRPAILRSMLPYTDAVLVTKQAIALTGPGYRGIVAVSPVAEESK